jgi:hypothetical protein
MLRGAGGAAPLTAALCLLAAVACGGEAPAPAGEAAAAPGQALPAESAALDGEAATTEGELTGALTPEGAAPLPDAGEEEPEGGFLSPENQLRILLFFPSASGPYLVPEERIIFLTDTLTSQVKQAVSELIGGPHTEGILAPFPPGTELEGVFLPGTGVAVVNLGPQALSIPGGSDWEESALFSLVNTVARNFPEIHRVQLLVEGQEVRTLAGHLDTSRPLKPDMRRVDWMFQRLLDEKGSFQPHHIGPELPPGWVPPEPVFEPEPEPGEVLL